MEMAHIKIRRSGIIATVSVAALVILNIASHIQNTAIQITSAIFTLIFFYSTLLFIFSGNKRFNFLEGLLAIVLAVLWAMTIVALVFSLMIGPTIV